MGLRINTNVQSLSAQHRLAVSREEIGHTSDRMASGSRIVRAMDDAAGLAISENLRASIRSTNQNIRNAHEGFGLLQTADGALNEVSNIVVRMKELAVQAASDTNGDKERGYLDHEYQQLKLELDRIAQVTTYNGRPLLNGEGGEIEIQVGASNDDFQDRVLVAANFNTRLDELGLGGLSIGDRESARSALDPITDAQDKLAVTRGAIGAGESRLNSTLGSLTHFVENTSAAFSKIRDADFAHETAQLAKYNILSQAGVAVLAQANSTPGVALKLLG
jgi:flagellin